ncbi:hypothetical protein CERSUDRAFT_77756 [Gelatoporia subvermispora B]|uniref:Uncharacterized protein n=1 Tax=Ceriporiopsis subvermispora (strain B) TaxID=914234 RepID=M2QII6_CERS8|nr:hypothetical protein CERSUDRAFT_77756 [Gelatoporia subvermispora B]
MYIVRGLRRAMGRRKMEVQSTLATALALASMASRSSATTAFTKIPIFLVVIFYICAWVFITFYIAYITAGRKKLSTSVSKRIHPASVKPPRALPPSVSNGGLAAVVTTSFSEAMLCLNSATEQRDVLRGNVIPSGTQHEESCGWRETWSGLTRRLLLDGSRACEGWWLMSVTAYTELRYHLGRKYHACDLPVCVVADARHVSILWMIHKPSDLILACSGHYYYTSWLLDLREHALFSASAVFQLATYASIEPSTTLLTWPIDPPTYKNFRRVFDYMQHPCHSKTKFGAGRSSPQTPIIPQIKCNASIRIFPTPNAILLQLTTFYPDLTRNRHCFVKCPFPAGTGSDEQCRFSGDYEDYPEHVWQCHQNGFTWPMCGDNSDTNHIEPQCNRILGIDDIPGETIRLSSIIHEYLKSEHRDLDASPSGLVRCPCKKPGQMFMATMQRQSLPRHIAAQMLQMLQVVLPPGFNASPRNKVQGRGSLGRSLR